MSTRPLSDGAGGIPVALGERRKVRMLGFEMAQNVLQAVLDPAEIAGAVIAGHFEAFEQIGDALFEMGEGGSIVVADRHPVEPVRQSPQRIFDMFGIVAGRGSVLTAFQRRSQRSDALFEHREGIAMPVGPGQLIDLGGQRAHVVAEPHQRIVGRDIGDDGAKGAR